MLKQFNQKVLSKCLLTGIIMTILGIALQVAKAQLVLKKTPPSLNFIIVVVISYVMTGFLFSVGFYIFRNHLPGRTAVQKSIAHSLFVVLTVLIPGVLGMNAFDYEGLYILWTPYKLEQYFIVIMDVINFIMGGFILAKLFKDDINLNKTYEMDRPGVVVSGLTGGLLLPLLVLVFHVLAERIMPLGLDIPTIKAKNWYYLAFVLPLLITGGLLPWFYHYAKEALQGNWIKKSVGFFIVFFIAYWFMNISFLLSFGFSVQTVLFYFIITIPSLLITMMLNGFILETRGAVKCAPTSIEPK